MLRVGRRCLLTRLGGGGIASRGLSLFSNGVLIFGLRYFETQLIQTILTDFCLITIVNCCGLQSRQQQHSTNGLTGRRNFVLLVGQNVV